MINNIKQPKIGRKRPHLNCSSWRCPWCSPNSWNLTCRLKICEENIRKQRGLHVHFLSFPILRNYIPFLYTYMPQIKYSEPLKSTNLTELCQISLGRRWIRKSNKLTKSKVNPNGTPMYDKLCFGKFCCVKDEETPCGRNSQNIFKVVLNTTKNTHVILGRQ